MRDFYSNLRNNGIHPIDPLDAHVTIIDCSETQIPVFSSRDQLSLNRARSRASEYLSTMPYYELVLSPSTPKLEAFGPRIGIEISEADFIMSVRKYIGDIFKEEANIDLSSRSYVPHMTAGTKMRGAKASAKHIKHPRIPRNLHVVGHDVSERVFFEDPNRQRQPQRYRNQSSLRAVS
jgi:hypothetical protein